MINWYKQKTLMLILACFLWNSQAFNAIANSLETETIECDSINAAYRKVYSFETENYYINVCQLDSKFYYHRQSKLNGNSISVSAQPIVRGDVFQAIVGKITYFVGIDNDRHYSSVMLNNNEIVFEPEIKPPTPSPRQNLVRLRGQNTTKSKNYQTSQESEDSLSNASLDLDAPEDYPNASLVCTRELSAFHPHLDGWQKLLGKSTNAANQYAVSNGYNFSYDQGNPNLASITTQSGAKINLSIANQTRTVEQVCIESDI